MTKKHNGDLIKEFEKHMVDSGLAKKTIRSHVQNVDLFINDYLLCEEIELENGHEEIDEFFDWAIRKNVVISQSSLRQFASSVKKFYRFLFDTNKIDAATSREINKIFKESMPDWLVMVQEQEDALFEDEW